MHFQPRRFFLPAFLLLLLAGSATAQRNRVSFGIEGGPGLSTLRGNTILKNLHRSLPVFTAGAYARLQLPGQFYLRAGLGVGQMGSRSIKNLQVTDSSGNLLQNATFTNRFTYVTVPVLVGKSFLDNHVFVQAGPWAGLLLRGRYKISAENISAETDVKEHYKSFNAGLAAGAGIRIPLAARASLTAELRDQLGLVDISDEEVINGGSIRTNVVQLLIGLQFGL